MNYPLLCYSGSQYLLQDMHKERLELQRTRHAHNGSSVESHESLQRIFTPSPEVESARPIPDY